jgi:glucokinase
MGLQHHLSENLKRRLENSLYTWDDNSILIFMYIVADIGGTKMRVAGSEDLKRFSIPIIIDTPQNFEIAIRAFADAVEKLTHNKKPDGVVIGVPGVLNKERTTLLRAPHLPTWDGREVAIYIEEALRTKVYLENDTALVGLGEAHYGGGQDQDIMAYLTVSTGVGGVRIVNGIIDQSAYGFEPGHQLVVSGGVPQELESLISGSAMFERYGKHPKEITDPKIWDEYAHLCAVGVYNTIVYWSPNAVVLGGSMFKEVGIKVSKVEEYVRSLLTIFPEMPLIKKAELGDLGGLYGGLAYLKTRVFL